MAERPWVGLPRICESPPPHIQSNVIQYANFAFKAVGFNNMTVCNPFFDAQPFNGSVVRVKCPPILNVVLSKSVINK
ncbi:hypothetical protein I633_16290 [Alteromonas mediterranea 615]|uniref:Uncharacterized protein n=1 Tax=Alteromonas mediterranea 615 TaxID=1300253 RepID=S5AGI7_9ALTE|nr:hypothetical protein I633_16290 [Alteromonas mediterranea 615]